MRKRTYFEDDMMDECEEIGCGELATSIWNGRKLCNEHYGTYSMWEAHVPGAD